MENFDGEFADFLAGCRSYLMDRYISLATDVDTLQGSFLPMRDEQLKGLLEVPVDLLTKQRLQRFIAYCDTALGSHSFAHAHTVSLSFSLFSFVSSVSLSR